MRLTDTDALMESFEHALGAAPCELNGYEIWEILNAQERVDAIPVEWLKKQIDCARLEWDYDTCEGIHIVLKMWQKEQEAQDG